MKRKSMSLLMGSLLTVCLVGVGFASWIIIEGDTHTEDGTIVVEQVSTKKLEISTPVWGAEGSALKFGAPENSTAGWLRKDSADKGEVLSVSFTVTVANSNYLGSFTSAVTVNDNEAGGWAKATSVGTNYIKGVTVSHECTTTGTAENSWVSTYTVTVEAEWGEFWKENPYTYYNKSGRTASGDSGVTKEGTTNYTWAEHANLHLGNLYTYLEDVTFTVTLTTI